MDILEVLRECTLQAKSFGHMAAVRMESFLLKTDAASYFFVFPAMQSVFFSCPPLSGTPPHSPELQNLLRLPFSN